LVPLPLYQLSGNELFKGRSKDESPAYHMQLREPPGHIISNHIAGLPVSKGLICRVIGPHGEFLLDSSKEVCKKVRFMNPVDEIM
jgi:hypothetical protein